AVPARDRELCRTIRATAPAGRRAGAGRLETGRAVASLADHAAVGDELSAWAVEDPVYRLHGGDAVIVRPAIRFGAVRHIDRRRAGESPKRYQPAAVGAARTGCRGDRPVAGTSRAHRFAAAARPGSCRRG